MCIIGELRAEDAIVKAIECQAGVAEGSDQAPESADESLDAKQLLEKLELGLIEALGLVAQSERNAAMMAVDAVLEFVVSVPGWERRGLGGPLWQLLTAVNDLEVGRVGSAYVIADNKLALNAGWDHELLAVELQALVDLDFGVEITGFSIAEVDLALEEARNNSADSRGDLADETPRLPELASATTRAGDLWLLDRHRLLCGDARGRENFDRLLEDERMDLVFTDPPYNVPIEGHVCGLGRIRHREFAMGAGEMSREEFTAFFAADPWARCGSLS
jgi:hypothetical protein